MRKEVGKFYIIIYIMGAITIKGTTSFIEWGK
jgi:hypothetical protein